MLPPVYATLTGDSTVAGIVDTRVYRHGDAPQNTAQPYITWQLIAGTPELSIDDAPDIDRCTLQVDCWSPKDGEVVDLAQAARAVLEQHGHVTGVPLDTRDPETRLYRITLEMDWLLPR